MAQKTTTATAAAAAATDVVGHVTITYLDTTKTVTWLEAASKPVDDPALIHQDATDAAKAATDAAKISTDSAGEKTYHEAVLESIKDVPVKNLTLEEGLIAVVAVPEHHWPPSIKEAINKIAAAFDEVDWNSSYVAKALRESIWELNCDQKPNALETHQECGLPTLLWTLDAKIRVMCRVLEKYAATKDADQKSFIEQIRTLVSKLDEIKTKNGERSLTKIYTDYVQAQQKKRAAKKEVDERLAARRPVQSSSSDPLRPRFQRQAQPSKQ